MTSPTTDPENDMTKDERRESLMPGGVPKWIRCYDSGPQDNDRYTVIYTKADKWGGPALRGTLQFRGMNAHPCQPQGVGMWGEAPAYVNGKASLGARFGRRISFDALPPECRSLVLDDYREIWGLK